MQDSNPYRSMDSKSCSTQSPAEGVVLQHLRQSEQLLWSGRPRQGIVIRPIDIVLIPLSILAFCFFSVWSYMAVLYFPLPLKLFSILAIGFGFYLAYGRFWLDARRRRNTIYAVTNERCLWISERAQSIVIFLPHKADRQINLVGSRPVGTIAFGRKNGLSYMYARAMGLGQLNNITHEFEMIDDAKCVYDTIRKIASRIQ